MDYNGIVQLIGTVGFPIVACAAMFWKMNDQDNKHKEEVDKLTEALENNTQALTALTTYLSR